MKKTTFALTFILAVLAILGVQFVKSVAANGWILHRTSDGPPAITIEAPHDNETVPFNNVVFSFTLTRPSYNWTLEGTSNIVVYVNVTLDGTVYRRVDVNSELSVPFTYSLNLTGLKGGAHSVGLNVFCKGSSITEWSWSIIPPESVYYNVSSGIVNFTVDSPEPSATPEPTSQPATFPATLIFISSAGIAIVAIGLLVYFKKRK